jgi:hypothetical protein
MRNAARSSGLRERSASGVSTLIFISRERMMRGSEPMPARYSPTRWYSPSTWTSYVCRE